MIRIKIGNHERELREVSESWIHEQIGRRKDHQEHVCVHVIIHAGRFNMILSTPFCSGTSGACRPPNREEERIFKLWEERKLNQEKFSVKNILTFLKQLPSFLGGCHV